MSSTKDLLAVSLKAHPIHLSRKHFGCRGSPDKRELFDHINTGTSLFPIQLKFHGKEEFNAIYFNSWNTDACMCCQPGGNLQLSAMVWLPFSPSPSAKIFPTKHPRLYLYLNATRSFFHLFKSVLESPTAAQSTSTLTVFKSTPKLFLPDTVFTRGQVWGLGHKRQQQS